MPLEDNVIPSARIFHSISGRQSPVMMITGWVGRAWSRTARCDVLDLTMPEMDGVDVLIQIPKVDLHLGGALQALRIRQRKIPSSLFSIDTSSPCRSY